uniref:Enoyl-[acyl-carrier-protein] reductase [NADH], chloroplastic n=1 Tax=Kalanchoe fedtschenkoi TaxID=63787 RepID=A0A7N0ZVM5_KALFE
MAATAATSMQMAASRPSILSARKIVKADATVQVTAAGAKLASSNYVSSTINSRRNITTTAVKFQRTVTKAMAESSEGNVRSCLAIDLKGKRAFIAGIADDNGYGWAIAKSLAAAGAEILVGTWVPALNIFETSLRRGKFDESRVLPDGSLMQITKVYPLDAVFDNPDDVPEDIKTNKRYAGSSKWTVQEVAESVKEDFGSIDILVHSLANGPEVSKPLLETSRKGYLAAISASSYSFVSLLKHFAPIMNPGGATVSLTYIASERIIPGYGGGMSSAKAALESDTQVLAFEAGRKHGIRVNTISAGPLGSRAAKAIGFIDTMIEYSFKNAPIQKELSAEEVGNAAAFLASPLASAITGATIYVDNGLNAMGVGVDSPVFENLNIPKAGQ